MDLPKKFLNIIDEVVVNRQKENLWDKDPRLQEVLRWKKKEVEAILIYPYDGPDTRLPYSHWILSFGLKNLWIPNKAYPFHGWIFYNEELVTTLMRSIGKFKIFLLGTYFETLPDMIELTKRIQQVDPENRFVIMGWQWTTDKDARQYALESWVDAINIGHASPFFRVMEWIHEEKQLTREILFEKAEWVLATLKHPNVPKGKFPEFSYFPLMWWPKEDNPWEIVVDIPHYLDCPNNCDFCSQMKTGKTNVVESIIETCSMIKKDMHYLKFSWPTFEGKLVKSFRDILQSVEKKQWFKPKTGLTLDSKQFQNKNYEETLALLNEFSAISIQLGINAVNGEIAKEVGRNNNGKTRTSEELQEEIDNVLRFVREHNMPSVKIDMLITPFDTPESIEKIIKLHAETLKIQKETGKNIWMYLSPLVPYPGTKLYKRHKDKIDFRDYSQLGSQWSYDPTIWKYDEKLFWTTFLRYFSAPFMTANATLLTQKDEFRANYLEFLALSMTHQYLQWKKNKEDMDVLFPEYKDSEMVTAIFNAITTQSIDLTTHARRKEFFKNNPAKYAFDQMSPK